MHERLAEFVNLYETPVGFETHAHNVLTALIGETAEVSGSADIVHKS